jgi:predicted PurR-regulated permease PerM
MKSDQNTDKTISNAIEVFVRLGFLALLIAWCFQLVYPFAGVIMWSIILALATAPMYAVLNKKLGDKPKILCADYNSELGYYWFLFQAFSL